MIIKTPKRKQFVTVSNNLAQDASLSFEARGVLVYLLSHPENWRVLGADIERAGNISEEKRRRIMAELEAAGYLTTHRIQNAQGRWGWESTLHEVPVDAEQRTEQLGRGARNRSVKNRTSVEPDSGLPELRLKALPNKKLQGSKTIETKDRESVCTPDSQASETDTHTRSQPSTKKKSASNKSVSLTPGELAAVNICTAYFTDLAAGHNRIEVAEFAQEAQITPGAMAMMCAWLEVKGRTFSYMRPRLLRELWAEFNAASDDDVDIAQSAYPHLDGNMSNVRRVYREWEDAQAEVDTDRAHSVTA